ncbi:HlyD family secretion protein [Novosphingobium sp. 1949]|uniref:HlyD family secretion protein n=1 Tax=Novosphingobium organovorum TaxID=2930092 RepID=A0ABT0BDL9_9SPHN|nr:HlyD family secretion protein [Novosphingobium organovorum]MCJ2182896.1 HlyD family secretion protein [Novosphingobium organovorum]
MNMPIGKKDGVAQGGMGRGGKATYSHNIAVDRKVIFSMVIVAICICCSIWLFYYETRWKYIEETDDAQIGADSVTLSPRISGYIDRVVVADNSDVVTGQPLVFIERGSYAAQLAQAKAQAALARAGVRAAQEALREHSAAIVQAQARVSAARDKADYDSAQVRRYAPLAASGADTGERLSQLKLAQSQSRHDVKALTAAQAAQVAHKSGLEAQLSQAEAQLAQSLAVVQAAQIDTQATVLRAPISGRVGDKSVAVGQYVQAGTRLLSIVPLDALYVTANFKETQMAAMRIGQSAHVRIDALNGLTVDGHVQSIAPGTGARFSLLPAENATGNFTKITQRVPVRIAIEPSPQIRQRLVPGLSVTVTVDTRQAVAKAKARHFDLAHALDQERKK